MQIILI